MDQGKELHRRWKDFKDGVGAEMIKDAKLKFNKGLGPELEKLDAKWGTSDGQKAADKIKGIVTEYVKLLGTPALFGLPKKAGGELLAEMNKLALKHKIVPAVKKAGK